MADIERFEPYRFNPRNFANWLGHDEKMDELFGKMIYKNLIKENNL